MLYPVCYPRKRECRAIETALATTPNLLLEELQRTAYSNASQLSGDESQLETRPTNSVVEEGSSSGPVLALSCEGSVSEGRKRSRHSDRLEEVTRDMYEDGSGEREEGQGEGEGATSWKPYGCKTCRRRFRTEQVRAMTGSLEWFQMREGQGDGVWEGDSFVLICCLCGLRTRVQTVGR